LIDESLSCCVEKVSSSIIIPLAGITPHNDIKAININKIKCFLFIFAIHPVKGLPKRSKNSE
jgi:hypothetical protein